MLFCVCHRNETHRREVAGCPGMANSPAAFWRNSMTPLTQAIFGPFLHHRGEAPRFLDRSLKLYKIPLLRRKEITAAVLSMDLRAMNPTSSGRPSSRRKRDLTSGRAESDLEKDGKVK